MKAARVVLGIIVASVLIVPAAAAQESLQAAKDFYASAAYDDALAVLTRLDTNTEVQQYRAFCLIALGRFGEAQKAIEAVVVANPTYVPTVADVSPRVRDAFVKTRRQLLPEVARTMYVTGKSALARKDREAAVRAFEGLLRLIDSSDAETRSDLDEIRFLASGFLDLSRAIVETPPPPVADAARPSPAAPASAAAAPAVTAPNAHGPNAAPPNAMPAPKPAAAADVTPPVAIRQAMPAWTPMDPVSRQAAFDGAIRVSISPLGKVERAEMVRPVHPTYDRLLLQAAKDWDYQPARRGGVAVASEQIVEVQLRPRQ
jgi:tetratricopeptide (TPR) repeat protein